jgi:cell filamentation protein
MGALAHAHPFLDGNGRTIMVVHHELAARAGIAIAWDQTNRADYLQALTEELQEPEARRLDSYLKPFIREATERQSAYQTLLTLSGFGPGTALHGAPAAKQEEVKPTTQKIR